MITAWRVVHRKYADAVFSSEGARRFGGRWNSPGTPMVYTADSLALAMLEVMVHVPSYRQLYRRIACAITFSAEEVQRVARDALPNQWFLPETSMQTQQYGDQWVEAGNALVLQVPSVVVPHACNYIFNPLHTAWSKVHFHEPENLYVDPRLIKP